jgi:ribosomal protein L11 methyltransferase
MVEIGGHLWQATVRLAQDPVEPFADFIDAEATGLSVFETETGDRGGGWTITALYGAKPDRGAIASGLALIAAAHGVPEPVMELAPLPPADWLADAYAGFPARRIDRYYVHGSHLPPPQGGLVALHIDAATAFGSGEHATTEGCLRAIADLARRCDPIHRALDMGTGSGILAIAIAKTWRCAGVVAIDIDAESARVAHQNARLNQVAGQIRAVQGDGYRAPLAARGAPFDLIVSNILARPLSRMAPSLARRLAPGGVAILSGLLRRQAAGVVAAHRAVGLRLIGRRTIGEWQTLIMGR